MLSSPYLTNHSPYGSLLIAFYQGCIVPSWSKMMMRGFVSTFSHFRFLKFKPSEKIFFLMPRQWGTQWLWALDVMQVYKQFCGFHRPKSKPCSIPPYGFR